MLNAKRDHAARRQEVRHQLCRVIKCIFIVIPLHVNLRTSKLVQWNKVNPCLQIFSACRYDNALIYVDVQQESF